MEGKGGACGNWAYRKRFKVDNIPLDCNDFWSEKGFESLSSVGIADQSNDKIVGILAELLNPFQLIYVYQTKRDARASFDSTYTEASGCAGHNNDAFRFGCHWMRF